EATLKKWLKTKGITPQKITGYQKDKEFATSLKAYIDFKKIFGKVDGTNKEIIEKIIFWITIFTEKEIIEREISDEYPQITTAEINKILNLKYKGWAKLSEKLLVGLTVEENGTQKSIMDIMRSQKLNFMQIINSKKLGFNVLIDEENDTEKIETLGYEQVEDIHTSPANKKGIWQTILIIKEIEHIMGHSPKNIYVEFAREDGKSARTVSRYTKLEKLYIEAAKNSEEYKQVLGILRKEYKADKKVLDDRALYLYFMQNGKCLYSGNTLDIHSLHLYEIDHIIPRSYIKDDSFENLALVCRTENQHKGAAMLLNKDIINSQKHIWLSLFNNGLMSSKKFKNLTREAFSDEDMQGFIARQLVETRQITKHVTQLLTAHYVNTNIVAIKAELSSNLRKKYELYKNRDVNDYHHAYDAFLACTIGRYIRVCYPSLEDEFIYKEYRKFATATGTEKNGFGYIIDFFGKNKINGETGEVIWCGEDEIKQLVKAYSYKDCFVSRKTERLTGAFYNQTIKPKSGDKTTKLIPLKENLPVSKYGGYDSIKQAYYVVIE
ncbi:MAG: type II CRISPR RNA-guided endonuclease Cas9, partial [Oscillospiraceae bacterium]